MAMKKCKECGQEISSSAKTCPNCGKKQNNKMYIVIFILLLFFIVCWSVGYKGTNKKITITEISDFNYNIENGNIVLDRYKGRDKEVIINSSYNIDGTDYTVTNLENAVFNGCNATVLYIPKTIACVYDNTLAYLHAEHIDLYYEGTEEEWNAIFQKYEIADVNEKWQEGDAEGAGAALADKLNSKVGHEYDESKFTYHFNANINDIIEEKIIMKCPKCGSENIQAITKTEGKIKKRGCISAIIWILLAICTLGAILWIPLLTGGSKGKITTKTRFVCLNCGKEFK